MLSIKSINVKFLFAASEMKLHYSAVVTSAKNGVPAVDTLSNRGGNITQAIADMAENTQEELGA